MAPEEKTDINLGMGGLAFERRKKEPSSDTEELKKEGGKERHQELERKLREQELFSSCLRREDLQ